MDILGMAMLDYINGNYSEDIITETSISEKDVLSIPYLFRDYHEMPLIEKKALDLSYGKVLDVGCGAGSHSLYLQEKRNLEVKAIDISRGAIETCIKRGVKNVVDQDFFNIKNEKFDTILLLMNGLGICQTLAGIDALFKQLKNLLTIDGQVLLDSSDLIYMFDQEEDGSILLEAGQGYYGELQFRTYYKDAVGEPFDWLYLDFNTLQRAASYNGFSCEMVQAGEHYDYLAKLMLDN
ncbi:class I SAM-dependent methyltransferase [Spongiivirga sp. MCCC 1A20706]|uniref:class I SAM-dependent methyltransferase n=1 Tax=Spongiivirga sp. MCCC 1A20706 TaxID=3160963 RepID=UPI0039773BA7